MVPAWHRGVYWTNRIERREDYRWSCPTPRARRRWDPPAATRYQIGLYEVSETWERQQERQGQPSRVEFDIRYVKYLVSSTLILGAPYVATGIGCRLYRYSLNQIDQLVEPILAPQEPRYFRKRIDKRLLKQRFPLLNPRSFRDTSAAERSFVYRLSGFLAPWAPSHPNAQTPLAAAFDQSDPAQEGEQIHTLIDMDAPCKGWAGLIAAHNSTMHRKKGKMLPDPDSSLKLPQWPASPPPQSDGLPALPSSAPPSTDPFATTPLSPQELDDIKNSFQLLQRRVTRYSPGLLSVDVDGKRLGEFDIRTQQTLRLRVPNYASNIEVYGRDDEGPLLLAVFSVASIASSAVGRTVTFLLSAAHQEDRLPSHAVVKLTYLESPLATVRAWCAYSLRQLCERSWEWGRRVGATREPGEPGHPYLRWGAYGFGVVILCVVGYRGYDSLVSPQLGPSLASQSQSASDGTIRAFALQGPNLSHMPR
jgi:hypothetical protein